MEYLNPDKQEYLLRSMHFNGMEHFYDERFPTNYF